MASEATTTERTTMRVERSGPVLAQEYDVTLDLSEADRERFEEDPEGLVGELLGERGFAVNGVHLTDRFVADPTVADCRMMHLEFPEDRHSEWITVCDMGTVGRPTGWDYVEATLVLLRRWVAEYVDPF